MLLLLCHVAKLFELDDVSLACGSIWSKPAAFEHAAVAKRDTACPAIMRILCSNATESGYAYTHCAVPADLLHEEGRVLSRWGDAGWGRIVADGKHANRFSDELVASAVDMIRNRWQPQPAPQWVACVPSRSRPELVPDFATRLAVALGLQFRAVVEKTRDNAPQKLQQNTFHRCQNLDGAFAIDDDIPQGSVLLVDDVVDSGWTLTIVAALLRRAGSGPVFPLALASTSTTD
jgi:ATP-dependent DNA helicase RecQ